MSLHRGTDWQWPIWAETCCKFRRRVVVSQPQCTQFAGFNCIITDVSEISTHGHTHEHAHTHFCYEMKTVPHLILCDMWQYVRIYCMRSLVSSAVFVLNPCHASVKVKLILEQAMKVQKGEKSSYYSSFNMARVPDGLDVYRHDLVALPWEWPGTHCTVGWVVPSTGLDGCGNSLSHWDSITRPFSLCWVAIPTTISRPNELHRAQLFLRRW